MVFDSYTKPDDGNDSSSLIGYTTGSSDTFSKQQTGHPIDQAQASHHRITQCGVWILLQPQRHSSCKWSSLSILPFPFLPRCSFVRLPELRLRGRGRRHGVEYLRKHVPQPQNALAVSLCLTSSSQVLLHSIVFSRVFAKTPRHTPSASALTAPSRYSLLAFSIFREAFGPNSLSTPEVCARTDHTSLHSLAQTALYTRPLVQTSNSGCDETN